MRSPGGAAEAILRAPREGRVISLVSVPLAMECEATCSEPDHQLAAGLSEREVETFLDAVLAMAEPVKAHFLWRPQLRDPADEICSIFAGSAPLLVARFSAFCWSRWNWISSCNS